MITIKDREVLHNLMNGTYHPLLYGPMDEVIKYYRVQGLVPVITSAFRPHDGGVHGFGRGIDFRTWELSMNMINDVLELINGMWLYDPERPEKECLIYHDVGAGPHLHLQVHPNTIKLTKGITA